MCVGVFGRVVVSLVVVVCGCSTSPIRCHDDTRPRIKKRLLLVLPPLLVASDGVLLLLLLLLSCDVAMMAMRAALLAQRS